MFAKLKEKLAGGSQRIMGRTDLLEGVAAACALISTADGDASDAEVTATVDKLRKHPIIGPSFKLRDIEVAVNKQFDRANEGRTGRALLRREIDEAVTKSTAEDLQLLLLIAIDVADSEGGIDDKEMAELDRIAKQVGVNLAANL